MPVIIAKGMLELLHVSGEVILKEDDPKLTMLHPTRNFYAQGRIQTERLYIAKK